jgi:hypothetical protein
MTEQIQQGIQSLTRVVSPEPEAGIAALAKAVEHHGPDLDILRRPIEVSGAFLHLTPGAARDAA